MWASPGTRTAKTSLKGSERAGGLRTALHVRRPAPTPGVTLGKSLLPLSGLLFLHHGVSGLAWTPLSPSAVSGLAVSASTSPGSSLETQILRPSPRRVESAEEHEGQDSVYQALGGGSNRTLSLRTVGLGEF